MKPGNEKKEKKKECCSLNMSLKYYWITNLNGGDKREINFTVPGYLFTHQGFPEHLLCASQSE